MKIKQILLFTFILAYHINFTQNRTIDSLKNLLKTQSTDTTRVKQLISLSTEYFKINDSASCFETLSKGKKISQSNNNKFYVAVLRKEAFYLRKLAHYKASIDTLLKVVTVCDKTNLNSLIGTYNDIGVTYRAVANFEFSIKYGLMAAKLCESEANLNNELRMNTYNSLANSYSAFGNVKKDTTNFAKAIYNYSKAKNYVNYNSNKPSEIKTIAMIENNLGVAMGYLGKISFNQNSFLEAVKFHERALQLRQKIADSSGIMESYSNLGVIYHDLAEFNKSIIYCRKALQNHKIAIDFSNKINYKENANLISNYVGEMLLQNDLTGKVTGINEIIELAEIVKLKANASGDLGLMRNASENLSSANEQKGDYKKALQFAREFIRLNDSLLNSENSKNIEELSAKYETDRKNKENELLKKETEAQSAKLEKQKTLNFVYIIGFIFIIIFIIMIYKNLSIAKKANKEISMQKNIVEEKQKEIIESINYARRIQQSLLPNQTYLKKHLRK